MTYIYICIFYTRSPHHHAKDGSNENVVLQARMVLGWVARNACAGCKATSDWTQDCDCGTIYISHSWLPIQGVHWSSYSEYAFKPCDEPEPTGTGERRGGMCDPKSRPISLDPWMQLCWRIQHGLWNLEKFELAGHDTMALHYRGVSASSCQCENCSWQVLSTFWEMVLKSTAGWDWSWRGWSVSVNGTCHATKHKTNFQLR